MRSHTIWLSRCAATIVAVFAVTSDCKLLAVDIHDYRFQRTFSLPAAGPGSGGNVLFDPLPDGRILVLNGAAVSVETAPHSGTFSTLGTVPGFTPGFGPSFVAVSPDGSRAAAGSNGGGTVVVFETSDPTAVTTYAMQDFAGEWFDDRYLAVANSTTTNGVQVLDTLTSTVTQVIANVGGASGGVTFDAAGNLYTSNGFDFAPGGSEIGWVKSFAAADWQNALATSTPLDFEAGGVNVSDILTGYSIGFDASGNLYVAGADFFGNSDDAGYSALVAAGAVADALANPQAAPPITGASPATVVRKFPSPQDTIDFQLPPSWNYNAATGEMYLHYVFGDGTVSVYAVPEPGAILLALLAGLLLVIRRAR